MKLKRIISTILMLLSVVIAYSENNYKVTSNSRLNVRKAPSTAAAAIGSVSSGQEIEVLSIHNGWAKIIYNNKTGYVSDKYISPLPKPEPIKEEPIIEQPVELPPVVEPEPENDNYYKPIKDNEVNTPLSFGHNLSDNLNLYLTAQAGFGWSNFLWQEGVSYGTMAYSINLLAQLYFENRVSFIPRNWYSEIALGYNKLGATDFDMNYIHLSLSPLGYRIPLSAINIVLKAGVDFSFPLNDLSTNLMSWSANFQCGITGGIQFEWKQFAIGCNVIYDFTEVSDNNLIINHQTLNNVGVLGTISYKFGKFGHKK